MRNISRLNRETGIHTTTLLKRTVIDYYRTVWRGPGPPRVHAQLDKTYSADYNQMQFDCFRITIRNIREICKLACASH